jgi:hypothetical protein
VGHGRDRFGHGRQSGGPVQADSTGVNCHPGLFPPVLIDVTVGNQHFQEMHVDGEITRNVFLLPSARLLVPEQIYVIDNGALEPCSTNTSRRSLPIARRALSTLSQSRTAADIFRLQVLAAQQGADLHLAQIGADFSYPSQSPFDGAYMRRLYRYSFSRGLQGEAWDLPNATGAPPP